MNKSYTIEYLNEIDFKKKEKALRKYNKLAFKEFTINFLPELRLGNLIGTLISTDSKMGKSNYEFELSSDKLFKKVHGNLKVTFSVFENKKIVVLNTIMPESILDEGHKLELETYKGVIISKINSQRDKFKINLASRSE
ncbi:MAG: hypothetical protein ACK5HL_04480 [Bacilli bacterium]